MSKSTQNKRKKVQFLPKVKDPTTIYHSDMHIQLNMLYLHNLITTANTEIFKYYIIYQGHYSGLTPLEGVQYISNVSFHWDRKENISNTSLSLLQHILWVRAD